jgi:hypothetical protein
VGTPLCKKIKSKFENNRILDEMYSSLRRIAAQLSNNELQHSTAVWAGNEENYLGYLEMGVWGVGEGKTC